MKLLAILAGLVVEVRQRLAPDVDTCNAVLLLEYAAGDRARAAVADRGLVDLRNRQKYEGGACDERFVSAKNIVQLVTLLHDLNAELERDFKRGGPADPIEHLAGWGRYQTRRFRSRRPRD